MLGPIDADQENETNGGSAIALALSLLADTDLKRSRLLSPSIMKVGYLSGNDEVLVPVRKG